MMEDQSVRYPDISDLLALTAEGRRVRARMSFAEKVAWVEQVRKQLAPIDEYRRSSCGAGRSMGEPGKAR